MLINKFFFLGVVLGKDGGMIKQLWYPFSFGVGGPIGNGLQYLPWIHIDDLVKLIAFAIENNQVTGILNGVAPDVSFFYCFIININVASNISNIYFIKFTPNALNLYLSNLSLSPDIYIV